MNKDKNKIDELKKLINSDKLIIFTKEQCPNCKKVKMFLDNEDVHYLTYDYEHFEDTCNDLIGYGYSSMTLPIIVGKGSCLNGYNPMELIELIED